MGMTLKYRFDKEYRLRDISFEGLNGREEVSSTKEALHVMKIRNPAIDFAEDVKKGYYNDISDEDYQRALDTIKCVRDLWRRPDDPPDSKGQCEMNPLELLANAIRMVARLDVELRKYR